MFVQSAMIIFSREINTSDCQSAQSNTLTNMITAIKTSQVPVQHNEELSTSATSMMQISSVELRSIHGHLNVVMVVSYKPQHC